VYDARADRRAGQKIPLLRRVALFSSDARTAFPGGCGGCGGGGGGSRAGKIIDFDDAADEKGWPGRARARAFLRVPYGYYYACRLSLLRPPMARRAVITFTLRPREYCCASRSPSYTHAHTHAHARIRTYIFRAYDGYRGRGRPVAGGRVRYYIIYKNRVLVVVVVNIFGLFVPAGATITLRLCG